jgi:hypothetical protein
MEDYKTVELSSGRRVVFSYSDTAQSPRDPDYTDCNLTKMVCFHRNYILGDKHNFDKEDVLSWEELEKLICKEEDVCVIDPLYLYDHSGITISTTPFGCKWDSGQVGFVYITKEEIRKLFNVKRISKKLKYKAWEYLNEEVKTYKQYLEGDVYDVYVRDENDDIVESCSGYYGTDFESNGALEFVYEVLTAEENEELKTKLDD